MKGILRNWLTTTIRNWAGGSVQCLSIWNWTQCYFVNLIVDLSSAANLRVNSKMKPYNSKTCSNQLLLSNEGKKHSTCRFTSLSQYSLNTLFSSFTMISQNMKVGGAELLDPSSVLQGRTPFQRAQVSSQCMDESTGLPNMEATSSTALLHQWLMGKIPTALMPGNTDFWYSQQWAEVFPARLFLHLPLY